MKASLRDLFFTHKGRPCDKWHHYLDIYERHLGRFVDTDVSLLEIGVQKGGSLELWQQWLGAEAYIVGLDIDPSCAALGPHVIIGSQGDIGTLSRLEERGLFDVIIDDGGHVGRDQIISFETLYPKLTECGVYIVEDLHTAYWSTYGSVSFVEYAKRKIDELNAWHRNASKTEFAERTDSIHFYDSMVVFEKGRRTKPVRSVQGVEVTR